MHALLTLCTIYSLIYTRACVVTIGDAVSFFHTERVGGRLAIEGGLLPKYSVHIHTTEERHRLQGREGVGQ